MVLVLKTKTFYYQLLDLLTYAENLVYLSEKYCKCSNKAAAST